jgi:8-oxo-dGTP pyrophosphatase MutT (NUDIX family)
MLKAAVIVPLIRYAEPAILFVRRAAHLRRNPGQVAFPGGVVDIADGEDPMITALREFEEELGVPKTRVAVADRLEPVVTLSLNVCVTPYVGLLDPPVEYQVDAAETESAHEVPLGDLYLPGALREGVQKVEHEGREIFVNSWLFDHEELHVWGATARILHGLLSRYPSIVDLPLNEKA